MAWLRFFPPGTIANLPYGPRHKTRPDNTTTRRAVFQSAGLNKGIVMNLAKTAQKAYGFKNFFEHSTQLAAAAEAMRLEGLTRSDTYGGVFSFLAVGQPRFTIALRESGAFVFFKDPIWPATDAFTGSSMTDAACKALLWAREHAARHV